MPKFVAISNERHANRHWRKVENYGFAKNRVVVPLAAAELPKATLAFPIVLLADDNGFIPAALLSLDAQRNLFVAGDNRWIGTYVPAALRAHPFALLPRTEGDLVLCLDEETGLLPDNEEGGPFFDASGEIAEATRKVLDFLTALEKSRIAARRACTALADADLIAPWDITVNSSNGAQKMVGLHKVDEAVLNALPPEKFEGLRQFGAVAMAYCQILSMPHLAALGRLSDAHAAQRQEAESFLKQYSSPASAAEIDWSMFSDDASDKTFP